MICLTQSSKAAKNSSSVKHGASAPLRETCNVFSKHDDAKRNGPGAAVCAPLLFQLNLSASLHTMSISPGWEFFGAAADGESFQIGGLDVWKHEWRDTKERVPVQDPHYSRDYTFCVYEMGTAEQFVTFAAGEFSNSIYGLYLKRRVDAS